MSVRLSVTRFVRAVQRCLRRGAGRRLLFLWLGSLSDHPVCVQAFSTRRAPQKKKREGSHAPFELAALFVRLVRHGTLEDRTEEQEPARAVVQLWVLRAVVLQDVVDDL